MVYRKLVTYGEETSYGQTPQDVSRWVGGVTSFSGGVELASEEVAVLSPSRFVKSYAHGLDVGPSIEFYVQSPRFLKYAFGKTTNTGTSPPYTHLLEIDEDYELPSITLLEHRIGTNSHGYLYNGCRADKFTISWEEDSLLQASFDFKSTRVLKTTTLPSTTPDTTDFFRSSSKTVEVNGVQIGYLLSSSVTLSNNLAAFPRSGDFVTRHVSGNASAEAELELYYVDSSLIDLMTGKTRFDVKIRFTK
ncbi:MAG: phage tail tube protein, partial [Candidatus Caldarchaeum sp.]|nr:phage tail tube protein [Candidatus Caldarchaeum sp.]MDW8436346.1 phage tail tube protein [Candidatus Caldarchaeum sp.]